MKRKNESDSDSDEETFKNVQTHDNHIYFYGDVNSENAMNFVMLVNKFNSERKKYDELFLHIQSDGGNVSDAFAMADCILKSEIIINTIVQGCVASAGTLISIVGDYRTIDPHAVMLIHQPSGGIFGKKSEIDDEIRNLNQVEKMCKLFYKKYTKLTEPQLDKIFKHDIEWSAKQCLQYGLVDAINRPIKKRRIR